MTTLPDITCWYKVHVMPNCHEVLGEWLREQAEENKDYVYLDWSRLLIVKEDNLLVLLKLTYPEIISYVEDRWQG